MQRLELNILYWFTRVVLFFVLPLYISDVTSYEIYARKLIPGGKIPYVDWDFEYPPLAFLFISVPVWLHDLIGLKQSESTRLIFGFFLLPFDFLLYQAFEKRPRFEGSAFAYILLSSAMGLLIFDRFDLLVGFLLAWPFLSLRPATDFRFALFWGLGGALKIVPLLLAPLPALFWGGSWRERARRMAVFAPILLAPIFLSFLLTAVLAHGKISFLSHHSQRGVQIESLIGSLVMFGQSVFKIFSLKVESNFGAQHLSELPGVVPGSRIVFYGGLLLTLVGLVWQRKHFSLLVASWQTILAFVAFGYVLSPQFLLWLIPLGLCAAGEVGGGQRQAIWLAIFALVVLLTGLHFRYYWDYVNFQPGSAALVLLRNLGLVFLWGLGWLWLAKPIPAT